MSEEQPVELMLHLDSEEGDREELDRLTRQLLSELRDQPVESARLASDAPPPQGAKAAESISLGMITLAVAPQLLPFLIDFVKNWHDRQRGRRVRLTGTFNEQSIDFRGSEADLAALVRTLSRPESPDEQAP